MDVAALVAGSGHAAGLNLYGVTLLLGVFGRLGWAEVPEPITSTWVMVLAAILFVIEFIVDKVPYADNTWDAVHTVIRPLGAAVIGYLLAGEAETIPQALAAVLAGGLAVSSHTVKATTRAAVNTSPEPFSNIFLSLFEDGLVVVLVGLAVALPLLTLILVGLLVVAWVVMRLWRLARRILGRRGGDGPATLPSPTRVMTRRPREVVPPRRPNRPDRSQAPIAGAGASPPDRIAPPNPSR